MTKKTRIYFILADENLFHPHYFKGVLDNLDDSYEVVGVTLAKTKPRKGLLSFLKEQYALWGFLGFVWIALATVIRSLLSKVVPGNNFTIERIAQNQGIKFIDSYNVNNENHIKYIKNKKIDIIISSNGQIFKKELLDIPKIACINRHSALLPDYGGVLPVFWAMLNNEKQFGVSIHYMVEKIDAGDILYRVPISLDKDNSLFDNYLLAFDKSVDATIGALSNIRKNKIVKKFKKSPKGYFSFPSLDIINKFKRKHKTFNVNDIFLYFRFVNK